MYIKDGKNYLVYDGLKCSNVVGFIPTTHISMSPSGGGTEYQDVNLLNPLTKNGFVGDGESTEYKLDAQGLDNNSEVKVWINDEEVTDYALSGDDKVVTIHQEYDGEEGTYKYSTETSDVTIDFTNKLYGDYSYTYSVLVNIRLCDNSRKFIFI